MLHWAFPIATGSTALPHPPHMRLFIATLLACPALVLAQTQRPIISIAQALRTLDSGDTVRVAGRATAGTG